MPIFPITFSIPDEKIINVIPIKRKIISNLIPGQINTYIYDNEEDYYNEYRQSLFAVTKKKGGWDCMRHYEILANGCIPFFENLENCPTNTLTLLPKDLLIEGNSLFNKFKEKNINDLVDSDLYEYNTLAKKLLDYTKNNLTTSKIAIYILEKTGLKNSKNILYLSGETSPDYLRCLTLHGFKTLLGVNCHDYPQIPHIYKYNNLNYKQLYGKGISYSNLLDPILHDNNLDNNIEDNIKNKYFDIVIYGSCHRGMPFFDLVKNIYKPNEIIMLCGEDFHTSQNLSICNLYLYSDSDTKYNIFIRELC